MAAQGEQSRHLAAYRSIAAPPPERRARNLALLRARLREEQSPSSTEDPRPAQARSIVPIAAMMSIAIAAAVLLAMRLGVLGVEALREAAVTPMEAAPAIAGGASPGGEARGRTVRRDPPAARNVAETRTTVASESSPRVARGRARVGELSHVPETSAKGTGPTKPAEVDDVLRRELQLVRDARHALRTGDFARALALAERHASEYPEGVLAPERDAWRTEAACRLGRPEAAERLAAFRREHRDSPYAARVETACRGMRGSG